jgi:diadenosine tetraphosphate (Ap4A) HIT family hydrolase
LQPDKIDPAAFVLISTEHMVAFLDVAPLTRGHVLVVPRRHVVKVGGFTPGEGMEVSFLFLWILGCL